MQPPISPTPHFFKWENSKAPPLIFEKISKIHLPPFIEGDSNSTILMPLARISGPNLFLEKLSWKYFLSQSFVGWITMIAQQIFTENKFIVWSYCFSGPNNTYLFKFSNINCRMKYEICSTLTIAAPDVVLVSSLFTLNIFDTLL